MLLADIIASALSVSELSDGAITTFCPACFKRHILDQAKLEPTEEWRIVYSCASCGAPMVLVVSSSAPLPVRHAGYRLFGSGWILRNAKELVVAFPGGEKMTFPPVPDAFAESD